MATNYTNPSRPTNTPYGGRDPVGRKYLDNGQGVILTTESGAWIIAIDSSNTAYTTNRGYIGQTWDDLGSQTWDDMGTMTWEDLYTGIKPTSYAGRTII